MKAAVIGAGLAGCEAAKQLSRAGIPTYLYEMKPKKFSPAHKNENFAELVCSNSLKAERLNSAAGLLKAEMEMLSSGFRLTRCRCCYSGGRAARERRADRYNTRSLRRRIIILRCGGTDSFGGQRRYGICLYTVEI